MNSRIKHRSIATIITAVVVLAVILLNIVLSVVVGENDLYIDMTAEKFNEISTDSLSLLDEIDPEENNITIYFLADKDELQSVELGYPNSYSGSTSNMWGMRYVWELALAYAETYSFVTVETLNLKHDAEIIDSYKTTVGTTLTKQNIIIDNYTVEKDSQGNAIIDPKTGEPIMHHNFRVCKRDDFFTFDDNSHEVFAFSGDLRFTSTLLSLSGTTPTVYFVSGHGELIGDTATLDASMNSDYGKAQSIRNLFSKAGFVTKKIDLQTQYKELFEDESARVVVIYGPQSDYYGLVDHNESGVVDEISVLRKFLNGEDHHAMVFMDPNASGFENLNEYFGDYWGVTVSDNIIKDSGTNSLTSDGLTFVADYETDMYSVGTNLTTTLTGMSPPPSAVFSNAAVLELSDAFVQSTGFFENMSTTYIGSVFDAPGSAASYDADGKEVASYETTSADSVMTLCYEAWRDSSNNDVATYVLYTAGTDFASSQYVESSSYCNADVLFYAMRLMGRDTVPFEIDFKIVQSAGLDSITDSDATIWTVVLCTLIPVPALIVGTVVFVKRKHL